MNRFVTCAALLLSVLLCYCGIKQREVPRDQEGRQKFEEELRSRSVKDNVETQSLALGQEQEPQVQEEETAPDEPQAQEEETAPEPPEPEEQLDTKDDPEKPGIWDIFDNLGKEPESGKEEDSQEDQEPSDPQKAEEEETDSLQEEEYSQQPDPQEEENSQQPDPEEEEEEADGTDDNQNKEDHKNPLEMIGQLFFGNKDDQNNEPTVAVTVPSELTEGATQKQLDAAAGSDYKSAVRNKDGSVTYQMTEDQQQSKLQSIEDQIKECESKVTGDQKGDTISSVSHNEDFSVFEIKLEGTETITGDRLAGKELSRYGTLYRAYSGIEPAQSTVHFYDPAGNLIETIEMIPESK